jgi:hypothetical protein
VGTEGQLLAGAAACHQAFGKHAMSVFWRKAVGDKLASKHLAITFQCPASSLLARHLFLVYAVPFCREAHFAAGNMA